MITSRVRVASGVSGLDRLLNGLYIGDNVVLYDDAGSLAQVFCLNFIQASQAQKKPVIYVSFDRSPKNLLDTLGPLADNPDLTILDCFTYGKGAGSDVFLKFYADNPGRPCRVLCVKEPGDVQKTMDALYGVHAELQGDVRFVFESLTGMQKLWEGEDHILSFYSHSCPRLYDLNTVAYWIIEKKAHSPRLRASINQIAQVVVDLSLKRGKTSLTIMKAEKRDIDVLSTPQLYWTKDLTVTFETEKRPITDVNLGLRLKELRTKRGFSQTELSKLVGVTPSSISQIESNQIYPSLPALLKMAEVLSIDVSAFFQKSGDVGNKIIFPANDATDITLQGIPQKQIQVKLMTPVDFDPKAEPYLIEIPPKETVMSHFFIHKGEEMGYLLSGKLRMKLSKSTYEISPGDVIYLTSEMPSQWANPGVTPARLLWIKIK
jgi:transcriptional regulator with XRE-family HTH domain/KaiC/GvpD/RAD55 family RecA-like ATPase